MVIKLQKENPKSLQDFALDPFEWAGLEIGIKPPFDHIKAVNSEKFLAFMKTIEPNDYDSMCLLGKLFMSLTYYMRDNEWLEKNYNRIFDQKLPDGNIDMEGIKRLASEEYSGLFDIQEVTINSSSQDNDFNEDFKIVRVNCNFAFFYWIFVDDELISLNCSPKDSDKFELKPSQVQICWKDLKSEQCDEKLRESFEPIYWDGECFRGIIPPNKNVQIQPTFKGEVFRSS